MVKSVSLIDIDSKLPNLALMKISAYHKVVPFYEYDRLTKEEKEIVTNIIKSDR